MMTKFIPQCVVIKRADGSTKALQSPLARCLMDAATRRAGKCWCCGKEHGLTQAQTTFGPRLTCAGCEPRLETE